MTRNDIKELFPEATKEAISALLDINSADIGAALSKRKDSHEELEAQIATLQADLADKTKQLEQRDRQATKHEKDAAAAKDAYEKAIQALKDEHDAKMQEISAQLAEATGKVETIDGLQAQVNQLTQDVAARDATIAETAKKYRIRDELRTMKAKNVDVIWPLLDVDKITEKDGELEGLSEQVDKLRQSDAYLFDTGNNRGGFPGANELGDGVNNNDAINAAIRSMSGRG